ncbi:hypothetical protein BGZ60DRAFT_547229 [Tricladium varicosporioides]|nr:hypothetical protein BGZ60DRAFT_547229 [Hymenoscyphus varicosporioides]
MEKTAAIVGGSLAGLMNGIMLRHQGYRVTILEKDPATSCRQSQAAGISPGPDFLKFLERYDRTGRPFSGGKGSVYICAKDGSTAQKVLMSLHYSNWGLLYSILRANFDGHVSKACPVLPEPITCLGESIYLSGKQVTGVQFTGEKVLVQFTDVSSQRRDETVSDLVIAADGSSSTIRNFIFPKVRRCYSGYVTWRGTVPESQVSTATSDYFDECAKIFQHLPKGYMLLQNPIGRCNIPPGGRLINSVWYHCMAEGSKDLRDAVTDVNGKEHLNTVPQGVLQPRVWKKQKAIGLAHVPPPFAEVFEQTKTTFVTKVNDVASSKAVVRNKLFFVGDALCTNYILPIVNI